ncbi:MAG: hypothetical protein M1826_004122 [Phylliscum demangeonii]|nr:MAG: hypothetical protein M1826_004122 [Phylliscum demangeonii]
MDASGPGSGSEGALRHDGLAVEGAGLQVRPRIYRRDSNLSDASFFTDVEMAHDEVFAGPISESVPNSIASFSRRRSRADSRASFSYFREDEPSEPSVNEEVEEGNVYRGPEGVAIDIDPHPSPPSTRRFSRVSGSSVREPLLIQTTSGEDETPTGGPDGGIVSQKIYVVTEDLTIVIAGFRTSFAGALVYVMACVFSLGLAYLLFRWVPRWRVSLTGSPTPLRTCSWVVVENQWGEASRLYVQKQPYGRPLSTVFCSDKEKAVLDEDEDDDPMMDQLQFVDYRYIRFYFHPVEDQFVLGSNWKDPAWRDVRSIRGGLDADERNHRSMVFGKNSIDIEQKSIPQLLVSEAIHPFYVFQIASLILWTLDNYFYYAACIFIISIFSIISTIIDTRVTLRRLHELSKFECDVRVLRSGFCDIYEVTDPSLEQFPADGLLLSGDCIVNESMLTGESIPVSKFPATDQSLRLLNLGAPSVDPALAKHFLFCGTKIVRARRPQDGKDDEAVALAMVLRTGFNTTKGSLVRSMLFPKPSGFKFYRDSFRYISVMAGIACLGFLVSFINFLRLQLAWRLILLRALDLVTIVVPPALPATLSIGTSFALARLKKKQIFCISPQRVNMGGKLDVICFDKTGTLTEEGLDVLGLRVVEASSCRFSDLLTDAALLLPPTPYQRDPTVDYRRHKAALYTMATCHSLRVVRGERVGDPLDLKMFEFTGWSFEEGERKSDRSDDETQSGLSPAVARPAPGFEFDIDGEDHSKKVRRRTPRATSANAS